MTEDSNKFILVAAILLRILWVLVEVSYLRKFRVQPQLDHDKSSALLWDLANAIEPIGFVLGFLGVAPIKRFSSQIALLGLFLLVSGIIVRWLAIRTLGKFFTSVVTIREDHRIICGGLYKYVRHPAYTGALLAHAGLGLAFRSWVSISLSVIPFLIAAWYRMKVEETALAQTFGQDYANYAKRTARLIPRVY